MGTEKREAGTNFLQIAEMLLREAGLRYEAQVRSQSPFFLTVAVPSFQQSTIVDYMYVSSRVLFGGQGMMRRGAGFSSRLIETEGRAPAKSLPAIAKARGARRARKPSSAAGEPW